MTSPFQSVFFIDWCLGKTVATALLSAGAQVGVLCITPRKGIFQIETTKSQRDFQQIDYC